MGRNLVLKNQRVGRDYPFSRQVTVSGNVTVANREETITIRYAGNSHVVKVNSYPVNPNEDFEIEIGDFIEIGSALFRLEADDKKAGGATLPDGIKRVGATDEDATDPQIDSTDFHEDPTDPEIEHRAANTEPDITRKMKK